MTRTARVLAEATPRSLVLVDELGSGTDPDEGAALAIAVLDEDLARGGVTIATTHLAAVKEWAQDRPGVLSAAMEFDEKAGRPTFRVRAGASGRSRALAVAEKAGLPARVLSAAKKRLGAKWEAADAALTRLETETRRAREEADKAKAAAQQAGARLADLEKERAATRRRAGEGEGKGERTDRQGARDAAREDPAGARAHARGPEGGPLDLEGRAHDRHAVGARGRAGPLRRGRRASPRWPGPWRSAWRSASRASARRAGSSRSTAGRGEADVEVKGKRVRVALAALSPASSVPLAGRAIPIKTLAPASSRPQTSPPSSSGVVATMATVEVVLVGQRVDDALPVVEKAINDALLSGKAALRLVHGHGTGRLAAAVREFLKTHPGVASYRWGDAEGGRPGGHDREAGCLSPFTTSRTTSSARSSRRRTSSS